MRNSHRFVLLLLGDLVTHANNYADTTPNHHSSRQALLEEARRITRSGAKGAPGCHSRKRQPRYPRSSIRILATTVFRPANRQERRPLRSPTDHKHNSCSPWTTSRQPPSSPFNACFGLPQASFSFPGPRPRFRSASSCHRRSETKRSREPHRCSSSFRSSGWRQLIERSSKCREPARHRFRWRSTRVHAKRACNGRIRPRGSGRYSPARRQSRHRIAHRT